MRILKPVIAVKNHFGKIALGSIGGMIALHASAFLYSTHDAQTPEEYMGDLGYDLSSVRERPDKGKDIDVVRRIAPYFLARAALTNAISSGTFSLSAQYDAVSRTYDGGVALYPLNIVNPASTNSFETNGFIRFPNGDSYKLYADSDRNAYKALVLLHELGHLGPEVPTTSNILRGEIRSDLYAYRHGDKLTNSDISLKFQDERLLKAYNVLWNYAAFYDDGHDTALSVALSDTDMQPTKKEIFETRRNIIGLFDAMVIEKIPSNRNMTLEDVLLITEELRKDANISERFAYNRPNMDLYISATLNLLHGALTRLKERGPEPKPEPVKSRFFLSHKPS